MIDPGHIWAEPPLDIDVYTELRLAAPAAPMPTPGLKPAASPGHPAGRYQ